MKKILLAVALIAMAIMLLVYPQKGLDGARSGLELWAGAVVPSLLPFMVASFILLETGIVRLIAALFAPVTRVLFNAPGQSAYVLFSSALAGYPVGAALTSELYGKKQLSNDEAQHILRFTSMSGPVFITGAVSASMLGMPEAGAYLAISHYLSAVLVGIVFGLVIRMRKSDKSPRKRWNLRDALQTFRQDTRTCKPLGEILAHSVEKAVWTLLKIGGFIVFFSVVNGLLTASGIMDIASKIYVPVAGLAGLSAPEAQAILVGGIEMTTGCNMAASLPVDIYAKLPLISAIIAFGGLCIHMQTRSVCISSGLNPKRFVLAKTVQAMFAYLVCMLSLQIIPLTVAAGSFPVHTKTTAYAGIAFAAVSFALLLTVKWMQRKGDRSSLPFSRKL